MSFNYDEAIETLLALFDKEDTPETEQAITVLTAQIKRYESTYFFKERLKLLSKLKGVLGDAAKDALDRENNRKISRTCPGCGCFVIDKKSDEIFICKNIQCSVLTLRDTPDHPLSLQDVEVLSSLDLLTKYLENV